MTTMPEARRMAHDLMDRHSLLGWSFEFDNARRRAGYCHFGTKTISLSRHFVRLNGVEEIRLTILHEIAHALVGVEHGHDSVWRSTCLDIGGDGRRCYDADDVQMPPGRYLGVCSANPLHTFTRHKASARMRDGSLYCRRCGIGGKIIWSIRTLAKG